MKMRCLAGLVVLVAASTAAADTIYVPAGGDIQKAINMASDGDVIQLEVGLYQPIATIDPIGRAITIRGSVDSSGLPTSVVDGDGRIRVFRCISGEGQGTVFESLVIRGGFSSDGSGLDINNSSPLVTNCIFSENLDTGRGACINASGSNAIILNCRFLDNSVALFAGCIYVGSSSLIEVRECFFSGNSADYGGAIYNDSNSTFRDCTFVENFALNYGGAVFNEKSPLWHTCSFSKNNSNNRGGAIYNAANGEPFFDRCSITQNTTNELGGGIYSQKTNGSGPLLNTTLVCGNSPNQIYGPWSDKGDNTIATKCEACPDSDNDGVCDEDDQCPGVPDEDSDGDGVLDCLDGCPTDPNKTAPGQCGCNEIDTGIAGDYDCDGDFDMDDYAAMGAALGVCPGDLNGDALVDGADLNILLGAWGVCP